MKLTHGLGSRRMQRLQKIKFLQRRRIASELSVIKVRSASVLKTKPRLRFLPVKQVWLRRGCRKDYEHSGSFMEAFKPVILLAQVFALMPVAGVTAKHASSLSFSWRHLRTQYSVVVTISFGVVCGFSLAYAFRSPFHVDEADTIIFSISAFLIAAGFLRLARKWPALMLHWEAVERRLPPLQTQQAKGWLAHRLKMITMIITVCSLIEHLLSMLSIIYYVNACPAIPESPIDSFFLSNFAQFFYFTEYSTFAGIVAKVENVLSTFAWNFNDIFVMTISYSLAARFRHLNEFMLRAVKTPTTEQFWIQNRINYRNLCKLCNAVDDAISSITLLCFANNLYFICVKIFKSIQKKPSFSHTLYFWFSLGYLLGRTLVLSLFTADINEESKRPATIFRGVHRDNWCPESTQWAPTAGSTTVAYESGSVQFHFRLSFLGAITITARLRRFTEEVTTDVVALSGMKFFHLTRGLVLTVAGTIVTYELVLLQFNKEDKISDCYE